MKPKPLDLSPKDLHKWYLEVTKKLKPESYNKKAQKSFEKLSEEQKFIDKFICDRIKFRIKSACEFFLRYKDRPSLLWKKRPEYRKEMEKKDIMDESWIKLDEPDEIYDWSEYNEWLFKLAFKSVLEEK